MNKIILIGGTSSVGKTTLSKLYSEKHNFTHRIGTGFIRECLKTNNSNPVLNNYTFRPNNGEDLIVNFKSQAKIVCDAVNKCINRAYNEGTSLIVEGNHLLEEYLNLEHVDLFIIIKTKKNEIKKWSNNKTHMKRKILDSDINNILKIQDYIIENNIGDKIMIIENSEKIKLVDEIV